MQLGDDIVERVATGTASFIAGAAVWDILNRVAAGDVTPNKAYNTRQRVKNLKALAQDGVKSARLHGPKNKLGTSGSAKRIVRAAKGSDAADLLKKFGKDHILTPPPGMTVPRRLNANQLKNKLGIVDYDPKGLRALGDMQWIKGYGDTLAQQTPNRTFPKASKAAKGVMAVGKRAFTNVYENSPGFNVLRKLGFGSTQEERILREADRLGLKGAKAAEYLADQSTGRLGRYAYGTKPGMGGDLIQYGTGQAPTTHGARGTGNIIKTAADDVLKDVMAEADTTTKVGKFSGTSKVLGKGLKSVTKTLPIVAGIDDASVVVQDIAEGDVTGALLHTGDAIIDTFIGPFSLLATVPTASATGAKPRGVVSSAAAWLGIEESKDTDSLIDKIFG